MALWLLKTEPTEYAYDDLVRAKRDRWNGVTNALALKHIRSMKKGDLAFIYHTGNEKAVVGVAEIVSDAYPDPDAGDEKIVVVDLKPKRKLKAPVTLATIKADKAFEGWELLRIGRLSVMPVPEKIWQRIEQLGGEQS